MKYVETIDLFSGLNINPIPLEFSNELTTTKFLAGIQAKVNEVVNTNNENIDNINNNMKDSIENIENAEKESINNIEEYVKKYVKNRDYQPEVENKLDEMTNDGTLSNIVSPYVDSSPIFVNNITEMEDPKKIYVLKSDGIIYTYDKNNEMFISSGYVYGLSDNLMESISDYVRAGNYATVLPDCNNALGNSIYKLLFTSNSENIPLNLPISTWIGTWGILLTFAGSTKIQLFINETNIWIRSYYPPNWNTWTQITKDVNLINYFNYKGYINISNYQSDLPNVNNQDRNSFYILLFSAGETNLPVNLPITTWMGTYGIILNFGGLVPMYQIFINDYNIWTRKKFSDWDNWISMIPDIKNNKKYVVDINGTGDYTSFTAAINEAIKYKDSEVMVNAGEYDILQEFLDLYGTDFFENYTQDSIAGILISNGININFHTKAILKFNYKGNNQNVMNRFSPINGWTGDFIINGMNLETSKCRYSIHDELSGWESLYMHKYINCNIKHDNTNNHSWRHATIIGGGLGINGKIFIENCIFDSIILNPDTNDEGIVSYHNASSNKAKSFGVIKNCFFKTGTVRLAYYGTSNFITEFIVCNNKLNKNVIYEAETVESKIENIKIYDFNNEI